jgi:SAM-dependent methyltransferase
MYANLHSGAVGRSEPHAPGHTRIAETWQRYYEDHGYGLWGFSPSPTAKILADAVLSDNPGRSERIEVVDWGCGYGRDSLYFIELGFDVIGIDVSNKAIALARAAYKRRQATGIPLPGSASFHVGDIRSIFESRAGQKVHAFFLQQSTASVESCQFLPRHL